MATYGSYSNVVTDKFGNGLAGASVTVYNATTLNLATIYSDSSGTVLANPFLTDGAGNLIFYALDGAYDLKIVDTGFGSTTVPNVVIKTSNTFYISSYASLTAAVASIGSSQVTLVIDTPTICTADTVVPSTLSIQMYSPGAINQGSYALAINSPFSAPGLYVFTGSGAVTFGPGSVKEVYPEWWGAVGNGIVDSKGAIQSAINSLSSNGYVLFHAGIYSISSTITVSNKVGIVGSGINNVATTSGISVIKKNSSFSGDGIILPDSSSLQNISIDGDSGNSGDGIVISGNGVLIRRVTAYNQGRDGIRIGTDAGTGANSFRLDDVRVKNNGRYGLKIHDGSNNANAGTITQIEAQNNVSHGLEIGKCMLNNFMGILSENNTGLGIHVTTDAQHNAFWFPHAEGNTGGYITFDAGSTQNSVVGPQSEFVTDNGTNTVIYTSSSVISSKNISIGDVSSEILNKQLAVVGANSAGVILKDTVAAANNKIWAIIDSAGTLILRPYNDDGTPKSSQVQITQSGSIILTGALAVGNSAVGDVTATAKVKKIEVYDQNQNSIGFIQVYQGP